MQGPHGLGGRCQSKWALIGQGSGWRFGALELCLAWECWQRQHVHSEPAWHLLQPASRHSKNTFQVSQGIPFFLVCFKTLKLTHTPCSLSGRATCWCPAPTTALRVCGTRGPATVLRCWRATRVASTRL